MTTQGEFYSIYLPSNGELLDRSQIGGFAWEPVGYPIMLSSGSRVWA